MVLGLRSFLVGACGRRSEDSRDNCGFSESGGQQRTECGKVRGSVVQFHRLICISFACWPLISKKHRHRAGPSLPSAPRSSQTSCPLCVGWDQMRCLPSGSSHSYGPRDPSKKAPRAGAKVGEAPTAGGQSSAGRGGARLEWSGVGWGGAGRGGAGPTASVEAWTEAWRGRGKCIPGGGNAQSML